MTKSARAARTAVDEDDLLSTAARLFREHGYEGTTLRAIASAAGVLPGSVHYRFPSKEDLLVALMRRGVEALASRVRAAVEAVADPVERVRHGLRAHLELLLSGDDAVAVLLFEWRSVRGGARRELIRLRDGYEALWDRLLVEAAATGRVRPGVDVALVRLLGFGAVNAVAAWWRPGGRLGAAEIADAVFDYLGRGVLLARTEEGAAR